MNEKSAMIYDAKKKNVLVAYLLYIFFGFYFQLHRFYAGNKLFALFMLILPLLGLFVSGDIGSLLLMVWVFIAAVDIIYIPFMVQKANLKIIKELGD